MFAKLSGIVDSVSEDCLIIDVSGVGYEVFASNRTLGRVGQHGDTVSLLIHTQVREDAITLFGFIDAAEQQWFRLLHGVQGVGPKAALAILAVCPPEKLGFAIAAGDADILRQADGVGPKLATRIVTELKDKAQKLGVPVPASTSGAPSPAGAAVAGSMDNSVDNDAVSALVNLGYARSDAYTAVLQARQKANDNNNLQEIIKLALKELAR